MRLGSLTSGEAANQMDKDLKQVKIDDRKNINFIQLSKSNLEQWRVLIRNKPLAAEIMYFFFENMGADNAVVCSYKVLEEVTGKSRATIGRAIKVLKEGNWIEAIKIGTALAYVVNERVAWQTHGKARQYAMFKATVVATKSEQDARYNKTKLKRVPVVQINEQPSILDDTKGS